MLHNYIVRVVPFGVKDSFLLREAFTVYKMSSETLQVVKMRGTPPATGENFLSSSRGSEFWTPHLFLSF